MTLCQVVTGHSRRDREEGPGTHSHSFLHSSTRICEEVSVSQTLFLLGAEHMMETDVVPQRLWILQGHKDLKHVITIRCKKWGRESIMMTECSRGTKWNRKERIQKDLRKWYWNGDLQDNEKFGSEGTRNFGSNGTEVNQTTGESNVWELRVGGKSLSSEPVETWWNATSSVGCKGAIIYPS